MSEQQQGDSAAGEHSDEVTKHPLSIWTSLAPGDVVAFLALGMECVGTVESKTSDGLIVWLRDDLNERKVFHFRECESVRVVQGPGQTAM